MTVSVPTVTELTLAAQLLVDNVCTKFLENLSEGLVADDMQQTDGHGLHA